MSKTLKPLLVVEVPHKTLAQIDKLRGDRSRAQFVRDAVDSFLGDGPPIDYAAWVRNCRRHLDQQQHQQRRGGGGGGQPMQLASSRPSMAAAEKPATRRRRS